MTTNQTYCLFNYDVPVDRRSDYSRIRKVTSKFSVMQSWSCYIIPSSHEEVVRTLIDDLNNNGGQPITYSVLPFDKSANDTILEIARTNISNLIIGLQETMYKNIAEMQQKLEEDETLDISMPTVRKIAAKKAKKKLKELEALAAVFLIQPNIELAAEAAMKKIEVQLAWKESQE